MITHHSQEGDEERYGGSHLGPGCVDYYLGWVDDADQLFRLLWDEIAWEQHTITYMGAAC